MKKRLIALVGIICIISMIPGCTAEETTTAPTTEAPIELRVAHFMGPGCPEEVYGMRPYLDAIEEASGGKVKFTIYGGGNLVPPMDCFAGAVSGITDISFIVTNLVAGQFLLSDLIGATPLLPSTVGDATGSAFWYAYEKYPEVRAEWAGTHVITVWDNVTQYNIGTNVPINTWEDLEGLRIRVAAGPPSDLLSAMGAVPVQMPSTEIYSAMEKGVIDGWTLSWAGMLQQRLHEVTKYLNEVGPNDGEFFAGPAGFVMNQEVWDSLPADIQEAITQAGGGYSGAKYLIEHWLEASVVAKEEVLATSDVVWSRLTQEEFDRWVEIAVPLWDENIAELEAKGLPAREIFDDVLEYRYAHMD